MENGMTHLAAIREAEGKILDASAVIGGNRIYREEMQSIAQCVLRILDEAEKDSTCRMLPPDIDVKFYHCSRCSCKISGGFRRDAFYETEWWNDPYCPGCGRRIEREDS